MSDIKSTYEGRQRQLIKDASEKTVVQYTYGESTKSFTITLTNKSYTDISNFFGTFPLNNYTNIKLSTAIESQITWTKNAITYFKDFLSNLKIGYEQAVEMPTDVTVAVYVDVLAVFAYLRHSMTVFILLQKEKIVNIETISDLKGTTDAETISRLQAQISSLTAQLEEAQSQKGADVGTIEKLKADLDLATKELQKLDSQLKSQTSLTQAAQAELAKVQMSIVAMTAEAANLTQQVRQAQGNAAMARQQLASQGAELSDAKAMLDGFKDALNTTVAACSSGACPKLSFTSTQQIDAAHQKINKYIHDLEERVKNLADLIGVGVPIIAQIPTQVLS